MAREQEPVLQKLPRTAAAGSVDLQTAVKLALVRSLELPKQKSQPQGQLAEQPSALVSPGSSALDARTVLLGSGTPLVADTFAEQAVSSTAPVADELALKQATVA